MRRLSREAIEELAEKNNVLGVDMDLLENVGAVLAEGFPNSPARAAVSIAMKANDAPAHLKPSRGLFECLMDMIDEMSVPVVDSTPPEQ